MIQNFSVCVCVVAVAGACMSSVTVAACRVLILPYLLTGAWDMGPSALEVPQNKKTLLASFFCHRRRLPATAPVCRRHRSSGVCVCVFPKFEYEIK